MCSVPKRCEFSTARRAGENSGYRLSLERQVSLSAGLGVVANHVPALSPSQYPVVQRKAGPLGGPQQTSVVGYRLDSVHHQALLILRAQDTPQT